MKTETSAAQHVVEQDMEKCHATYLQTLESTKKVSDLTYKQYLNERIHRNP